MDSCVVITGNVFLEVSVFPKRDISQESVEALGIFKQVCNGALEAFCLKPLCSVVQRLGELQVTCGLYFWSCFSEVGIVAGGTDSGPCIRHGRVGLCPELLPCMSEWFSIWAAFCSPFPYDQPSEHCVRGGRV